MRVARDDDPVLNALATLPPVLPDEARARQTRSRCRSLLERPPRHVPADVLERATVCAVCVAYAWHIVQIVRLVVRWPT